MQVRHVITMKIVYIRDTSLVVKSKFLVRTWCNTVHLLWDFKQVMDPLMTTKIVYLKRFLSSWMFQQEPKIVMRYEYDASTADNNLHGTHVRASWGIGTTRLLRLRHEYETTAIRPHYDCARVLYDSTISARCDCTTTAVQTMHVRRRPHDYGRLWYDNRATAISLPWQTAVTNLLTDVTALTNAPFVTSSKFKLSLQFTLCKERFSLNKVIKHHVQL